MSRLPPLSALRACEATARHLSVSRAAQELHVTPAAVSQQIRSLEDWLGVRLFTRTRGRLCLTTAAETYMAQASAAFRQLREATAHVAINAPRATVTIAAPASFAAKWLVPRIGSFRAAFPSIQLRIQALTQPIAFSQLLMDVGIGFGWDQEGGLTREPLLSYEIFPVISAQADAESPVKRPADLASQVLIEDEGIRANDQVDWRTWYDAAGVPAGQQQTPSIWLNSAAGASEAVAHGHGIALARSVLVEQDLACGRLRRLFDTALPGELSYDLVYAPAALESSKTQEVKAWLEAEAYNSSAGPPRHAKAIRPHRERMRERCMRQAAA